MSVRSPAALVILFVLAHAVGFAGFMASLGLAGFLGVPTTVTADGRTVFDSAYWLRDISFRLSEAELAGLRHIEVHLGDVAFTADGETVRGKWKLARDTAGVTVTAPPDIARPRGLLGSVTPYVNYPGDWRVFSLYLPWLVVSGGFLALARWLVGRPVLAPALEAGLSADVPSPAGPSWPWLVGGLAVVVAAFVRLQTIEPFYFLQDDNVIEWFPGVLLAYEELWRGRLPEWGPYQLGGAPLLSLGYYGLSYPPLLASYAFSRHVLGDVRMTADVSAFVHLTVGFALCFGCGRAAGLRPAMAMAAGLSAVLCGYTLIGGRSWAMLGLPWMLWLPGLSWCLVRFARGGVGPGWAAVTGLLVAGWYHAGFTPVWLHGLLFFALAVLLLRWAGPVTTRDVLWSFVALGLGVSACVPFFLVQQDVIGELLRSGNYGNGITSGMLCMLAPYPLAAAGHPEEWGGVHVETMGHLYYWGTVLPAAFFLALATVAVRAELPALRPNLWLLLAGVALVFTLGHSGMLWTALSALPVFGRITNHPFRLLPEVAFFGSLAGGLFLQRVLDALPGGRRWLPWLAVATAALMLYHANWCRAAFYSYADRPYPELPAAMRELFASGPPGRTLGLGRDRSSAPGYMASLRHSTPTLHRVPALLGYDPLVESSQPFAHAAARIVADPPGAARAFGVRWVLVGDRVPEPDWPRGTFNTEWHDDRPRGPMNHLERLLGPSMIAISDPVLTVDGMTIRRIRDPDALAFFADTPKEGLPLAAFGDGADVDVSSRPGGGAVVVNVLWRRQWQVSADGVPLVAKADDWGRIAVEVPAGTRTLALRFRPPWTRGFLVGVGVLAVSVAGGVALVLAGRRRDSYNGSVGAG